MVGATHNRATAFASRLLELSNRGPVALLAGGETTLEVKGKGKGGRNQEFALVAARKIEGAKNIAILSAGTDGTDGPTDAAGAFVDGTTRCQSTFRGARTRTRSCEDNDSYTFFDKLGRPPTYGSNRHQRHGSGGRVGSIIAPPSGHPVTVA